MPLLKLFSIGFATLLVCSNAFSAIGTEKPFGWRAQDGKIMSQTEARKSVNGFGGWLLVTPGSDWQKEWQKPSTETPNLKEAKLVKKGETAFVLIFFANPKLDSQQKADVRCNIKITRPNGTISINQSDVICFQGKVDADPRSVFLANPNIGFTGEPNDPLGKWIVEIDLIDKIRDTKIPLKTSFRLE